MRSLTKARIRALEVIFEAESRDQELLEVLERRRLHTSAMVGEYPERIIRGIIEHGDAIDEALQTYSKGWTLDRMPAVDRAILKIGAWELLYNDEVPDAVAVSEATGLARTHSTDDSPRFVNGLLGRLQKIKPSLLA